MNPELMIKTWRVRSRAFVGAELTGNKAEDLRAELVKPIGYFHAEEFVRRVNGNMTGPYEGIRVVDAEACVIKLIEMLKSSGLEPMGMSINAGISWSWSDDEKRWLTSAVLCRKDWPEQGSIKHSYFACFHYCVTQAKQFTPSNGKIYLTFDRQENYVGNAQKIFNQLKAAGGKWGDRLGDTLAYSSKKESVLLQAADLLAWHVRRHVYEYDRGNKDGLESAVWTELLNLPRLTGIWDQQKLKLMAQQKLARQFKAISGPIMTLPDPSSGWGRPWK